MSNRHPVVQVHVQLNNVPRLLGTRGGRLLKKYRRQSQFTLCQWHTHACVNAHNLRYQALTNPPSMTGQANRPGTHLTLALNSLCSIRRLSGTHPNIASKSIFGGPSAVHPLSGLATNHTFTHSLSSLRLLAVRWTMRKAYKVPRRQAIQSVFYDWCCPHRPLVSLVWFNGTHLRFLS